MPPDAQQLWEATLDAQRIPFAWGSARVTIAPLGATGDVRFAWRAIARSCSVPYASGSRTVSGRDRRR